MAGGRKPPGGRNTANARIQVNSGNLGSGTCNDDKKNFAENLSIGRPLAPKHVPIPTIPVNSQLFFEALSLAICLVAAGLQFLNLYRTVWWLPQSYNEYSMNFYLMDSYLLIFIVTMASRQFIYALFCKSLDAVTPSRWLPFALRVMRILLLIAILGIFFWCLYHMVEKYDPLKILYLCYPISIYLVMFGTSIGPFFDISTPPQYVKEDKKTKFLLDKPLHNCSLNATAIRAEVACLKSDFNLRLKRALFAATGSAFLCGIAPVIYVPPDLHFDVFWVLQYIVLIWLGRLGTQFTQAYPVRYCDVLHRAALHLGKWSKVENKNYLLPAQPWNDGILWPHGSLVKYNKEIYRSEGLCTAAEPGNIGHHRFYALFGNPTVLQLALLSLELSIIATQIMILVRTTEWYKILSMSLLTVTNYYTLFRLVRDYLVCLKVYRAEQIVQEKAQMALSNKAQ